jgi:UDP-glucose 4-epimerase
MNFLVTGGAGYIGGTVSRLLLERGHQVTIYDSLCHSKPGNLPAATTFVEGDLQDSRLLTKTLADGKFDGVLHFAALIEAGESMKRPDIYFRNNTAGTLSLLECMNATGTNKLVFSSTAACYGEPKRTPILETDDLKPTNAYGESKLLSETMMHWFSSRMGLRFIALRYFNVAGAIPGYGEAHEPESHLIPLVLDAAMGLRENIRIYGTDYPTVDGTCIRDYIHVADLAEAHILAMDSLNTQQSAIYNVGTGSGFTVRQIIESAKRVTGRDIPIVVEDRRPGDPAVLVASSDKIQQELGWKPKFADVDSIIASAWQWHQELKGRTM